MHLLLHPTEEKDDAALRDNDNLVCLNVGGKVSESEICKEEFIEVDLSPRIFRLTLCIIFISASLGNVEELCEFSRDKVR